MTTVTTDPKEISRTVRAEIRAIYQRLRAGDEKARNDLILATMNLAEQKVKSWVRKNPNHEWYYPDLVAESYVALIEAINSLRDRDSDVADVPGYLRKAVANRCADVMSEAEAINAPASTRRDHKKDDDLDVPQVIPLEYAPEPCQEDPDKRSFEMMDQILGACRTDEDRQIVTLAAEYWTQKEIGARLVPRRSASHVSRQLAEIYERFQKQEKKLLCE